ncbi:unnamed protein product [Arctogadus glacialis]
MVTMVNCFLFPVNTNIEHTQDVVKTQNWTSRKEMDPRTMAAMSSPNTVGSASSIEDVENQLPAAQVYDEHVQSGGVAMETGDLKAVQPGHDWLQEYAIFLAGLNLSFLHLGEDSELEVDTPMREWMACIDTDPFKPCVAGCSAIYHWHLRGSHHRPEEPSSLLGVYV